MRKRHQKTMFGITSLFFLTACITLYAISRMDETANIAMTEQTTMVLADTLMESHFSYLHTGYYREDGISNQLFIQNLTRKLNEKSQQRVDYLDENSQDLAAWQGVKDIHASRLPSISILTTPEGQKNLHFVKILTAKQGCLNCHNNELKQGWEIGQPVAAIQVSRDITKSNAMSDTVKNAYFAFSALGVLGLLSLLVTFRKLMGMTDELETHKEQTVELKKLVERDVLTNIANRRAFEEALSTQWHLHTQHQEPLSLLVFDLDHFKGINDTFGHAVGDEVLKAVAENVEHTLRTDKGDFFARYGGEEFAVILPNTPLEKARYVAERVRMQVAQTRVSDTRVQITASIGCSCFVPEPGMPQSRLFEYADIALYAAKGQGRNCVVPH